MDEFSLKAQQIKAEIDQAQRILLHLHPNSDSDSIGSALGLKIALQGIGKKVDVIQGDDSPEVNHNFIPEFSSIIPKSFKYVDLNHYDLFLILDASSPNQITDEIELAFPLSIKTINIDHHPTNPNYADITLLVKQSPATSEIIYDLLNHWGIEITSDIATCLFVGIWGDTGGFRWQSTSDKTFNVAADLIRHGAKNGEIISKLLSSSTKIIKLFGKLLSFIEIYANEKINLICINNKQIKDFELKDTEIRELFHKVNHTLSSSSDAVITGMIREENPGEVSLSMRNNNLDEDKQCDVSRIALAIGGGGHKRAAGARFTGKSVEEVRNILFAEIKNIFPDWKL